MKHFFIFLLFVSFLGISLQAYNHSGANLKKSIVNLKTPDADSNKIYTVVSLQSEFPGWIGAMYNWINTNLKYPQKALDNQCQGKIIIQFIVERDGSLSNTKVIRDGVGCDAAGETLRLIQNMPKWKPGMQDGEKVRVQYTLPVTFEIPKK